MPTVLEFIMSLMLAVTVMFIAMFAQQHELQPTTIRPGVYFVPESTGDLEIAQSRGMSCRVSPANRSQWECL